MRLMRDGRTRSVSADQSPARRRSAGRRWSSSQRWSPRAGTRRPDRVQSVLLIDYARRHGVAADSAKKTEGRGGQGAPLLGSGPLTSEGDRHGASGALQPASTVRCTTTTSPPDLRGPGRRLSVGDGGGSTGVRDVGDHAAGAGLGTVRVRSAESASRSLPPSANADRVRSPWHPGGSRLLRSPLPAAARTGAMATLPASLHLPRRGPPSGRTGLDALAASGKPSEVATDHDILGPARDDRHSLTWRGSGGGGDRSRTRHRGLEHELTRASR